MVSYEDILYPLNLGYGLRDIYDLAPWAFDLLIFALVLSAIFKPVMEKLPIFASKKDESHKLAGILSLIFAGSTVYWMQVQGTNLMAASAYIILIMFAILGIFVYNLIASTTWGAKHKVISGIMAFFLTFGLCQAVFGVGDIFSDVFPIFTALFVFLSRILLLVALITALILLIGRYKDGGTGGGPSGGGSPSSGGGGAGFWKKAKDWIPYKMRSPSGRKELDLKEYENKAEQIEVNIDKTNLDAQELNKLLTAQNSLLQNLENFFTKLAANLVPLIDYFRRQNQLDKTMVASIQTWNNTTHEFTEAIKGSIPQIEKEFVKLNENKNNLKLSVDESHTVLSSIDGSITSLKNKSSAYELFFSRIKDEISLQKIININRLISNLNTKEGELSVVVNELSQKFGQLNKILQDNSREDLAAKLKFLEATLENDIKPQGDRLLTHQANTAFPNEAQEFIKFLNGTNIEIKNIRKLINETETRNKNFLKTTEEMNLLAEKVKKIIGELGNLNDSIQVEFNALDVKMKSAEEKEEQEKTAEKSAISSRKKEVKTLSANLNDLKSTFAAVYPLITSLRESVWKSISKDYDAKIKNLTKLVNTFNKHKKYLLAEQTGNKKFENTKVKLLNYVDLVINQLNRLLLVEMVYLSNAEKLSVGKKREAELSRARISVREQFDSLEVMLKTPPREIDELLKFLQKNK